MPCSRCPFFSGEVPADVCARCSRGSSPRRILAGAGLLVLSWVAGHTLTYFFTGTFWAWPLTGFASGEQPLGGHPLPLPADYRFPVDLSSFPAFGVVLGLLYGIAAALPALGASMLGLWVGVVLALASWRGAVDPWYSAVLLAGAVAAGLPWGGARWWSRRLALGVGLPTAFVVAAHAVSVARTGLLVHLLPAGVAVATVGALLLLAYREVRWRSLRLFPVFLATLLLLAASPLLFSLTVTFPYLSYQLLWDRFSVEALSGPPAGGDRGPELLPGAGPAEGPSGGGSRKPGPPVPSVAAFDRRRAESVTRFAEFAGRYPGNVFASEALIQEARLLNLRVTATAAGQLRFSEDRIAPEALPIYASLIKLAPASVAAVRSRLEQALWSLQNGRFEEARQRYHDILVTYETHVAPNYQPPADLLLEGVCLWPGCLPSGRPPSARLTARPRSSRTPKASEPLGDTRCPGSRKGEGRASPAAEANAGPGSEAPGTGLHGSPQETQVAYYEAYLTARQALAFLAGNGQIEGEPLRLFLRLSPSAADYRQRLEELVLLYPEDVYPDLDLLADVQVALARGLPDEDQRLSRIVARQPRGEGSARALYRLAELARGRGDTPTAEGYLRRLVEEVGKGGADPLSLEVVWAQALLREGLGAPGSPGFEAGRRIQAPAGQEKPSFTPWPLPFP